MLLPSAGAESSLLWRQEMFHYAPPVAAVDKDNLADLLSRGSASARQTNPVSQTFNGYKESSKKNSIFAE